MPKPIVRLKAQTLALREDDAGAWDPIGFFAVDQVTEDVERAEGLRPFGGADPGVVEAIEHRRERRGGALEEIERAI